MNNNNKKFNSFLQSLKTETNSALIESITQGFPACFESRTFESEFDTSKYTIPSYFTNSPDWEPDMWHNNVCPAYVHTPTRTRVWIEADEPDDRENPDSDRFVVTRDDENGDYDYSAEEWFTESEEELYAYLKERIS
jgi:hypothetical protein